MNWAIDKMYADKDSWKKDYDKSLSLAKDMDKYKVNIAESADHLLNLLKRKDQIWQLAERVYVYARMKKDEDNTNSTYIEMAGQANILLSQISSELAFIIPALIEEDYEKILSFMDESENLRLYKHYLEDIFRLKSHILSKEEERILALSSQIFNGPHEIFTAFNDGDTKFGFIKLTSGEELELTHGNYIQFMENSERHIRKEAFEKMYAPYKAHRNTLASSYDFTVRTGVMLADIRNYKDPLESALATDKVERLVYENLISQVENALPSLHKYMSIRKRALKIDDLEMYDIYLPLFTIQDDSYSFGEAAQLMIDSLAPLGEDYIINVKNGIQEGWIDLYERPGKSSGAYSFGSYDSMPYILLNYNSKLKDVFTLAHEMGHSMHSFYTRKTQPYIYGGHSIFTAEVASTVNEVLLIHHLLKNSKDTHTKRYLLNLYIEAFRTTLFRQTMFAEFEKESHEASQAGTILTASFLEEMYAKLNVKYHGKELDKTSLISHEWSRIPHFYRPFYVYKYATGYSAANAIASSLLEGREENRKAYLEFLSSGEKDYPIELLRIAGVNMDTREPVYKAMEVFESLVKELDLLV